MVRSRLLSICLFERGAVVNTDDLRELHNRAVHSIASSSLRSFAISASSLRSLAMIFFGGS